MYLRQSFQMSENIFQQITDLRKSGNLDEAWNLGCPAVQENPNDQYLKGAFFWICYVYLKKIQADITSRSDSGNGDITPRDAELERINFYVDWIIWLQIPPGGYEYRSLLLTFQKNLEFIPKLITLLVRHSGNLFEDEDKKPFINDKGESPSLMLKFARKAAKAWLSDQGAREVSIEELQSLFQMTRSNALDKKNLHWLNYDEAKCLTVAKRFDDAKKCALAVLREKQTESWAWAALANTFRSDDIEAAITLFSKALSCAQNDVFALPILKGFAPLLANSGMPLQASACVDRAVACYVENGWKIKSDLEKMLNEPWYDCTATPALLQQLIVTKADAALDFLYGGTMFCVGVIQNIHKSGKGFHAYIDRTESVSVRLGLYDSNKPPNVGDFIQLTLARDDHSVLAAIPTDQVSLSDVKWLKGVLLENERGLCFVDDVFVPPDLARENLRGQQVKTLALMSYDNLKNRYSWKAAKVDLA